LLLTACILSAQGLPQVQNQNGTIAGTLRTSTGAPAVGVRVAALAQPDAIQDLTSLSSFASLAETDSVGRYRLENIPPGRYYIVAGRVDTPTFFPGAVQAVDGTLITVAASIVISGIDFTLNNVSVGRADSALQGRPFWIVPLQTRMEGDSRVPLFADGKFPTVRFTHVGTAPIDVPLNSPNATLPFPDYAVSVENLPGVYVLKSLVFESTDLQTNPLQLPAANSRITVPVPQSIILTLMKLPEAIASGVRVAGKFLEDGKHSIYLSGRPGAIYADGTWEFKDVPPGRHTLVTLDNPRGDRALGATMVVGDRDLLDINLSEISVVPAGSDQPRAPAPAENRLPGLRIPPSAIHGRVLDAETHEPLNAGKVIVNSNYSAVFSLNDDGTFEIPNLLTGSYQLEAIVYGIGTVLRTVELDEKDASIELTVKP
jgi:hypothetical protein